MTLNPISSKLSIFFVTVGAYLNTCIVRCPYNSVYYYSYITEYVRYCAINKTYSIFINYELLQYVLCKNKNNSCRVYYFDRKLFRYRNGFRSFLPVSASETFAQNNEVSVRNFLHVRQEH